MAESGSVDTTKMSTKGQVIIPKGIREYINAGEDTIFTVMPLDKETIVMKKLDRMKLIKEFRAFRAKSPKFSEKEINEEIQAYRREKKSGS